MSHCPTCKESIISQTPSLIGKTECTSDCPEAITCQDIIPSNCVFYSGSNLSCSGVVFGDTVTVAINKLDAAICQGSTQKCRVSIDFNDTCCNYLGGKLIAGTGITITRNIDENTAGCKTLTISEGCNTWNDVGASSSSGTGNFRNGWVNTDPLGITIQKAQYSNVKGCTVKLRGLIKITSFNNSKIIILVLPASFVPPVIRRFSITVKAGLLFPAYIDIYPSGEVKLFGIPAKDIVELSLDGIFFETV